MIAILLSLALSNPTYTGKIVKVYRDKDNVIAFLKQDNKEVLPFIVRNKEALLHPKNKIQIECFPSETQISPIDGSPLQKCSIQP